tara:strand:- start:131 stop:712 length:582 start_codon:yes stop_codon:yes gene_type:complete
MNNLNINEELVSIKTDIIYKAIEINYYGELYINNLMPDSYIVQKNNGKILIFRFNRNDEIIEDLFLYNGTCKIYNAYLLDSENKKHILNVKRLSLLNFNVMYDTNWESLTSNYQEIQSKSRNDIYKGLKYKTLVNSENLSTTKETESVFKISRISKKDKNLTTIESFEEQTENEIEASDDTGDQIANLRRYRL